MNVLEMPYEKALEAGDGSNPCTSLKVRYQRFSKIRRRR
jgi:hypothetical protein